MNHHMSVAELMYTLGLLPRESYLYTDESNYRGVRSFEYPALEVKPFGDTADVALMTNYQGPPVTVGDFVDFLKSARGTGFGPDDKDKVDPGAYVWLPEFDAAVTGLILQGDGSVKFAIGYPDDF
jgi:hypothetical protein